MKKTIVVGIDESKSAREALRWAAEEARLREARLLVVMVWELPGGEYIPMVQEADASAVHDATEEYVEKILVAENLVPGQTDLDVDTRIMDGAPAPCLLRASEGAELLVVGARGHGQFVGMLLGSVSLHCVTHATCPVVVVRSHSDAA